MQRRAATAYAVVFLVVAAGAYAVIATTESPAVTVQNPQYELSEGSELTVGDRDYRVAAVEASVSGGGGHGGGGGVTHSATLAWTVESANYSLEVAPGDEVDFREAALGEETLNGTYTAVIANESGVSEATLREVPGDDLTVVEVNGVDYVVNDTDGDGEKDPDEELTPVDEFEGLDRVTVAEGQVQFRGNATTVNVTRERIRMSWQAPDRRTVELNQAANVSLGAQEDRSYFAYFPNNDTVYLLENPEGFRQYRQETDTAARYHQRENGLWGITIMSVLAAVLVAGLAYLPRKDT